MKNKYLIYNMPIEEKVYNIMQKHKLKAGKHKRLKAIKYGRIVNGKFIELWKSYSRKKTKDIKLSLDTNDFDMNKIYDPKESMQDAGWKTEFVTNIIVNEDNLDYIDILIGQLILHFNWR